MTWVFHLDEAFCSTRRSRSFQLDEAFHWIDHMSLMKHFLFKLRNKWSLCVLLHILKRLENYFTAIMDDHDDDATHNIYVTIVTLCFLGRLITKILHTQGSTKILRISFTILWGTRLGMWLVLLSGRSPIPVMMSRLMRTPVSLKTYP